jgi:hypothetical protein
VLDEGVNFIQKPFSMKDLAIKVRETAACHDQPRYSEYPNAFFQHGVLLGLDWGRCVKISIVVDLQAVISRNPFHPPEK